MAQVVDFLSSWLFAFFDVLRGWAGGAVSLFDWPANALGLPSEILAMAFLLVVLIVMWRAMGTFIT